MNQKRKHIYLSSIALRNRNVRRQDLFLNTLSKFFNSRLARKNRSQSKVLFLENQKEMNVQYLNYIKRKNRRTYKIKNRRIRIIRRFRRLQNSRISIINSIKKAKIRLCLSNLCQKKVTIIENRIKIKIINAQILAKIIANTLKKNRFRKMKNKISKFMKFRNINIIPSHVTGLKISVNGRLNKDRIVPRKTRKSFIKGRFKGSSIIDKGHVLMKNSKGHFHITVSIAINLFFLKRQEKKLKSVNK
ncbi:unnamed protein product (mitochondrion) [Sympodiomycopsis kandeliae]